MKEVLPKAIRMLLLNFMENGWNFFFFATILDHVRLSIGYRVYFVVAFAFFLIYDFFINRTFLALIINLFKKMQHLFLVQVIYTGDICPWLVAHLLIIREYLL